jgi:HPt (histidine-containing phosphotransfer) domain-containing protein
MDAYVAKPIRERELFQAMEYVLRHHAHDVLARPPAFPAPDFFQSHEVAMAEEFDRAAALERCGNDPYLLRELIDIFLEAEPGWTRDLQAAVTSGEVEKIHRIAHTLKGAIGNLGGTVAQHSAQHLEDMVKAGNLGGMGEAWEQMRQAIERFRTVVATFQP